MKTQLPRFVTLVLGACFALGALDATADPSGKWRLVFDNSTDNDGVLVLRVAPLGGAPIDVETKVPKSTSENSVAQMVRDSLKVSLGEGYHIEIDDGESVIIKKRGKTPKFELSLVSSSLTGLELKIKRD